MLEQDHPAYEQVANGRASQNSHPSRIVIENDDPAGQLAKMFERAEDAKFDKRTKTALKFNFGKYLAAADGSSITGGLTNPLNNYVGTNFVGSGSAGYSLGAAASTSAAIPEPSSTLLVAITIAMTIPLCRGAAKNRC